MATKTKSKKDQAVEEKSKKAKAKAQEVEEEELEDEEDLDEDEDLDLEDLDLEEDEEDEEDLDEDDEDEEEEPEPPVKKSSKKAEPVKKADKAPAKKAGKTPAKGEKPPMLQDIPEGHLSTNDVSEMVGVDPRKLRAILRKEFYTDNESKRYHWAPGSKELNEILAYFGIETKKEAKKPAGKKK